MSNLRNLSRGFTAGAVGGVANVVTIILLVKIGIVDLMGIRMPPLDPRIFLYKQAVWGGLWGLLLVSPVLKDSWWQRGLLLGILASAAALFYFMPRTPAGMMGLNAGALTWLMVLIVNSVYGLVAGWWYERSA